MSAIWFRVSGDVQGVGFRNYVVSAAVSMGIVGEVWNTRDGAVEGKAQGPKLGVFITLIEKGPGHVKDVVSSDIVEGKYKDYRISSTR